MKSSVFLALLAIHATFFAQATPPQSEALDVENYYSASIDVTPTSLNTNLMGDKIDLDTGGLSFRHVDIDIPGNSNLPVRIARTLSSSQFLDKHFGRWQLEIPRLSIRVKGGSNWWDKRCSNIGGDGTNKALTSRQAAYKPLTLDIPGEDSGLILDPSKKPNSTLYFGDNKPSLTTLNFSRIECVENSNGKESFLVTTASGNKYTFDRVFTFPLGLFRHPGFTGRYEVDLMVVYPSKVEDVNGNWVRYTYGEINKGPTKIEGNDGRLIELKYEQPESDQYITSILVNERRWVYQNTFDDGYLQSQKVILPDGRHWLLNSMLAVTNRNRQNNCDEYFETAQITHPNGVKAVYEFTKTANFRSAVPKYLTSSSRTTCLNWHAGHYVYRWAPEENNLEPVWVQAPTDPYANFFTNAVTKKTLINPDGTEYEWKYYYDEGDSWVEAENAAEWFNIFSNEFPNPMRKNKDSDPHYISYDTKWRTVVEPTGRMIRAWFTRAFAGPQAEGTLVRRDIFESQHDSLPLKSETYGYQGYTLPAIGGVNVAHGATPMPHQTPNYLTSIVTTMKTGDIFTKEYALNAWGARVKTTEFSNTHEVPKITDISYENIPASWILNLKTSTSQNGRKISSFEYDSKGRLTQQKQYGVILAEYKYRPDGTIYSVEDARGYITTFLDWKRAVPQRIVRADQSTLAHNVDNNGWITSTTNSMGRTTKYHHDLMGRTTYIDQHGNWNDTEIEYIDSVNGMLVRSTTGDVIIETEYDGLYRPIVSMTKDQKSNWVSYQNTKYDGLGRVLFQSFPSKSVLEPNGISSTYDALDRLLSRKINVDESATTFEYLSGNKTKKIDPTGAWTIETYGGYDGYSSNDVRKIEHISGLSTTITKNIWGQITEVTQYGSQAVGGSMSNSHKYYYNARQQLCRHYVPETGASLYSYDDSGLLVSYAKGQDNSGCGAPNNQARVDIRYDELGREVLRDYSDVNTPNVHTEYDKNGNITSRYRDGINWVYEYNDADMLTNEILSVDGRVYSISYKYNSAGHLIEKVFPSGRRVAYTNDGFGRNQSIVDGRTPLLTSASYHPSGTVKMMSYGNGQLFNQYLNDRLLPARVHSQKSNVIALDESYQYDSRGNLIERVTPNSPVFTKTEMTYDSLNRLTSEHKTGRSLIERNRTYSYDVLGNIRRTTFNHRFTDIVLDSATNRVIEAHEKTDSPIDRSIIGPPEITPSPKKEGVPLAKNTESTGTSPGSDVLPIRTLSQRAFQYDSRGNVVVAGDQIFNYDYSEQPRSVRGVGASELSVSYSYDGNFRRVKTTTSGKIIYNVFDSSGSLVLVDEVTDRKLTEYISGPNGALARISNDEITFLHHDFLGSLVTGTNYQGSIVMEEAYSAYGQAELNDESNNNLGGFTGHISDEDTGLVYMQARYYDPVIGRFYSNDPVGFSNTNNFNRYAYANNNPYKYVDPDGNNSVLHFVAYIARNPQLASRTHLVRPLKNLLTDLGALERPTRMIEVRPAGMHPDVPVVNPVYVEEINPEQIDSGKIKGPPPARGLAPIGEDGNPIELHHVDQTMDGPIKEMTRTDHRGPGNHKKNHPEKGKSKIDRVKFATQKKDYWERQWDSGRFK